MRHRPRCYALGRGRALRAAAAGIFRTSTPTPRPEVRPDVQPLGSVRLPLPSSRRPHRRRRRPRRHRSSRRRRRRALSAGGWLDANSESAAVADRLDTEFGAGKSSIIALFRSDDAGRGRDLGRVPGRDHDRAPRASPTTRTSTGVVGYAETGDKRFISTAGDAAYVVIELDMTDEESVDVVDDIRAAIVAAGRLHDTS